MHEYWAPNIWALYYLLDKVMNMVGKSQIPANEKISKDQDPEVCSIFVYILTEIIIFARNTLCKIRVGIRKRQLRLISHHTRTCLTASNTFQLFVTRNCVILLVTAIILI